MRTRPLSVVVLSGGPSRENAVSSSSGAAVAAALARRGHRVLPVRIEADCRWTLAGSPTQELPAGDAGLARTPAAALAEIADMRGVDAVFVALHGAFGEDGTVQGFLEVAGVPYTGSGVAASALAMDKERAKEVLVHHGLRTAPWLAVTRDDWRGARDRVLARAAELGYPLVVKPPREGSSFGVSLARDAAGLALAVDESLRGTDGRALVERRIEGTEVTCPVVGNRGDALRALPLVEIVPRGRELFDFEAKYEGQSEEICPARVAESVAARVRAAAETAHRVLGCDGVSRSDFIVDAAGEPWFLETNTVPGMTEQSLVPLSARAAGIDFARLCEMIVELAIRRASR